MYYLILHQCNVAVLSPIQRFRHRRGVHISGLQKSSGRKNMLVNRTLLKVAGFRGMGWLHHRSNQNFALFVGLKINGMNVTHLTKR